MAIATFISELPVSKMRQDYDVQLDLLNAQTPMIRHFIEQQAMQIANGLIDHSSRIHFQLPDRIIASERDPLIVPEAARDQSIGGWFASLSEIRIQDELISRLIRLEQDQNPAVSLSGQMIRFAVAHGMVHQILPDGRAITYTAAEGDDIPCIPAPIKNESAITASTDAIVEGGADEGRVQVPYSAYARRFFLPQWVAFNNQDDLLTNTIDEAEAMIASMQNFLEVLHRASAIAPLIVADEMYQRKRSGMLGQLINQGRALARYRTGSIIAAIQQRARGNNLNRGVSVNLPYFDDQQLKMRVRKMEVVPDGRIPFLGAFVVRAMRLEAAQVAQDTRLSLSTRRQLLNQLEMLERAFRNLR